MKTRVRIYVVMVLLSVGTSLYAAKPKVEPVTVLSTKRDVFYFKVEKEFMGAVVEIVDSHEMLVGSTEVNAKRMLIDFFDLAPGSYTIRITKENKVLEFKYERYDPGLSGL